MVPGLGDQPHHLLRTLLAHAPVGIFLTDDRGDCLYVNERWRELAGLTEEEASGQGWARAVHPDDRERVLDAWKRPPRAGSEVKLEYRLQTPHGQITWVQGSAVAVRDEAGRISGYLASITDITERTTAEEVRRHLAAIVESSDDAIISETLDGTLASWNPGAERIYGYRADEVLGQPRSIIIPPDRLDEFPVMQARLRRGERIEHYETVRVRKDGRRIDVSVSMSPLRDAAGRIVGAAGIGRDITERKRAERERAALLASEQLAREQAEAAVRARDDFLAIAAHELKTPLSTLRLFAQLAIRRLGQQGDLDPGTRRHLETVDREVGKLARLVGQLLDVSRIQEGQLALDCHPTDLIALAEGVAAAARGRTERRSIVVSGPSRLQAIVDPLRLEQVLVNLLDNAIKYSPDGAPIDLALSEPAPSTVEIAVRDHGSGIPSEKRPRIFERFYQAHTEDHASGMGLGLYISHQIVRMHAGTIRAEFPEDGGTRFVIHLPRDRASSCA